jgi:uncharacterized glyoxalase superfamily protein PhnB
MLRNMAITAARHVLAVHDADASARFFVDFLGFKSTVVLPGQWHFVQRDACTLMFGSCPDDMPAREIGCHSYFAYLVVDDVDALWDDFRSRGLELKDPETKPWGMREFVLATPDGHRMTFGQHVEL